MLFLSDIYAVNGYLPSYTASDIYTTIGFSHLYLDGRDATSHCVYTVHDDVGVFVQNFTVFVANIIPLVSPPLATTGKLRSEML
jgi:hypothetical protein